jgi:hypothetical protein
MVFYRKASTIRSQSEEITALPTQTHALLLICSGDSGGSMYGYIVIVLVHGDPVGVSALLMPWVAVTTFARYRRVTMGPLYKAK